MVKNIKAITEIPGWLTRLTDDGVPDSNAALYHSVPILYRAIQLRCDALASVPFAIYRGGEEEVGWPYPTPLSQLLWRWEASSLLTGASYGEIVRNPSGYQRDVRYRNPYDMSVQYDSGIVTLRQSSTGAVWKNNLLTGAYEMIYMPEYDPVNDILPGVSAARAANVSVKLLYALSKFPESYFEGGAMPVTLLGVDTADEGELKRVENWFKHSATSIKNAFKVLAVREKSITTTQLTPLLKDLAFSDLNAMAKHDIAMAFGVKQTQLDSEAANYATAQEDRLSFYEDTIKPRSRAYENSINQQFLERDGLRLEFRFGEMDIFQEDESQRADLLVKFTQAGIPSALALDLAGYTLTDEQAEQLNLYRESAVVENQTRTAESPVVDELRRWQRMAEKRVRENKPIRTFETSVIQPTLYAAVAGGLENVKTADDVKRLFDGIVAWQEYP